MCGCGGNRRSQPSRAAVQPRRVVQPRLVAATPARTSMLPTTKQPDSNQLSRERRELERKRRIAINSALGR